MEGDVRMSKHVERLLGVGSLSSTERINAGEHMEALEREVESLKKPIPMLLTCPVCHERHVDVGPYATKPHHTHACQHCGTCWRPGIVATVGVQFLPGFKDEGPCPP
jgi:hypothetical protein